MGRKPTEGDILNSDCCGCPYVVNRKEFYYRKADQWLDKRLRAYPCCLSTTLGLLRFLNFLFLAYGLLITGFCLFTLYGAEWLPDTFQLNNETRKCIGVNPYEEETNCTNAQIIFTDGSFETNLKWGGAAFWGGAVLQGFVAFWLAPLPFFGHLNTICCGTRTIPLMVSSSVFYFLLFLGHVALLLLSIFPETQVYFAPWVFSYELVWRITVGGDAGALLLVFCMQESFRANFLVPVTELDDDDDDDVENPHGKGRYEPHNPHKKKTKKPSHQDQDQQQQQHSPRVEMVPVVGGGETKTTSISSSDAIVGANHKQQISPMVSQSRERSWSDEVDSEGAGAGERGSPSWEIPPEQIQDGEKIGEGFFGQCFKAMWHQQDVVVKRFKNGIRGEGADAARKNFHREVAILVQLRHPRICQFLGACARPDNLFIVLEFMPNGSLQDYLHKVRKPPSWVPLSRLQKLRIVSDVALGLAYLHKCSPPIIHRDLTSGNVLLDDALRAKVSDFGLSRPYDYRMTLRPGNRFYMAPELLLGTSTYTTAVDIYSLALIMWEIYANERPYSDISASRMKSEVGINQVRPRLPLPAGRCSPAMETIMAQSWHADPCLRPTALALFGQLRALESQEDIASAPQETRIGSSNPAYPPPAFDDDDDEVPAPPPAAYGGRDAAGRGRGGGGAARGLSRPGSNANLSSEQMYIQQNVEHALAALEENLKTDEGKRMLEEDMVSKNLPDEATAREQLIAVVRQQTEDAARQRFAYARMQRLD